MFLGQGVVCVRSPWSDRIFAKAKYDNGYLSKAGKVLLVQVSFAKFHSK